MDNLKEMNFTELESSEMIQVRGGGLYEDLLARARELFGDVVDGLTLQELIDLIGGGGD
ncbi:hypothetical protein [Flavobacterium sp.]|uniref:hypothetical protein n=1 Tax=Flavobacterium sp. TaxID=239 RepID=UPI0031D73A85